MTVDTDEFERLCQRDGKDEEQWISDVITALSLYKGDFLSNLSMETWIIPITAYYHNLYIQTLLDVVPLLFERRREGRKLLVLFCLDSIFLLEFKGSRRHSVEERL